MDFFKNIFKRKDNIRTIAVKSKYDNPIDDKSKIDKWELFSGETYTQKFAFIISILLMLLSFADLIIMLAPYDVPNWDPAASIIALVVSCLMPYLLYKIAYRKKQGTVGIAPTITVPK